MYESLNEYQILMVLTGAAILAIPMFIALWISAFVFKLGRWAGRKNKGWDKRKIRKISRAAGKVGKILEGGDNEH